MLVFLRRRWFLLSLVVLITAGLTLGTRLDDADARQLAELINPRTTIAVVLFLMALSLDTRQLARALSAPRPVLWASLVNLGLLPLAGWALMGAQLSRDFACGLMIAATVPCTLAAASVWTRRAGGNDAVSLVVTLLTNALCVVVTPFWLNLSTRQTVSLDVGYMVMRLLQAVLIPTLAAQGLRLVRAVAEFATRFKIPIGVVAQICILGLVFSAACRAGRQLALSAEAPGVAAVALVWGSCIALHVAAMLVGWTGGGWLGFSLADRTAIAFAGSQKTLPIGILLATDPGMFGGGQTPFAVFPMLMYHASQLVLDTAVADRLSAANAAQSDQPAGEAVYDVTTDDAEAVTT